MALFAAVLWTPGAGAAGVFEPETFTLENGLQVVVIENHRVPVVTQMVWYKAGAADEPVGRSGVAHYLEHLMFKGTETMAPGMFSELVAANGGRENAFTSHDYTAYHQTVARDRLELVMQLEADRMANLVIDAAAARPELDVVLEERRSRADNDPASQLGEAARASLYLNYPYGTPVIGWEQELRGLTAEHARAFYARHYAPNNAVLVVAGDITARRVAPARREALRRHPAPGRAGARAADGAGADRRAPAHQDR